MSLMRNLINFINICFRCMYFIIDKNLICDYTYQSMEEIFQTTILNTEIKRNYALNN